MSVDPPELFTLNGEWEEYLKQVYEIYLCTIINSNLIFQGLPVKAKYMPATRGMGFGFWHLISEAAPTKGKKDEDERVPDLHRCERIRWVAWAILNAGNSDILFWENNRSGNVHVVIWVKEHDFAVVLSKRKDYYLLKTAYCVKKYRKVDFQKEWENYQKYS